MAIKGEIRNLDAVLRDMLVNYQPGEGGVDQVAAMAVVTLPIEVAWFPYYTNSTTAVITAASGDNWQIYSVPADEIHRIHAVQLERDSGDNELEAVIAQFPPGYRGGDATWPLLRIANATGGSRLYWPDPSGQQSPYFVAPTGVLLPPGGLLLVTASAVGVSVSQFDIRVYVERCKVFRALEPDLE